ncbi:MAG TPA: glycine oxidase ThiO [Longimicrobiales bacterium]|nr:glycine oxidase ThiO [Longimicrobiales bacterium]
MQEVVVIGGGLAGVSTAIALARRGAAVTLLDAERPGSAATGASAGMLAPQYESAGAGPLYRAFVLSREWYPRFASMLADVAGIDAALRWDGMLVANLDEGEHADAESMAAWQRAEGQRAEVIDAGQAQRLQPGIAPDVPSWLWLPDEGQVDAQQLAVRLPTLLDAAGVRVLAARRAVRLRTNRGAVTGVQLADGRTLDADVVVLAAGAWSDRLDGVPRRLGVRPVRGHILRFAAGAARLRRIVTSHAARYLVPRNDGSILAGSTMDETGFDRSIDDNAVRTVHTAVARLVPALIGARASEHWADLRPISGDGLPVIGAEPELPGLFYATGYGRNGVLLAPLAGEVLADMITGAAVPDLWREFSPGRLPLRPAL